MAETISFKKELDDLRKAGFTDPQVDAIWELAFNLSATIAGKFCEGIAYSKETPKQTDCPWK